MKSILLSLTFFVLCIVVESQMNQLRETKLATRIELNFVEGRSCKKKQVNREGCKIWHELELAIPAEPKTTFFSATTTKDKGADPIEVEGAVSALFMYDKASLRGKRKIETYVNGLFNIWKPSSEQENASFEMKEGRWYRIELWEKLSNHRVNFSYVDIRVLGEPILSSQEIL